MSFRENYEMAKESIRSGDMQKYISGKYKGIKGKVRGAKDFAKSSAGKKAIKHIILWRVLPIVLPLAIMVTTIIVIYSSIRSQVDSVLQAAMNWVTIESNDDEGYLHESYVVTPDAGIPGCILRPQTGIYADSKIASGVGIYKADFPSGLPTLEEILNKPDIKSQLEKDSGRFNNGLQAAVEGRGQFKSYMSLSTEIGKSGSRPVGDSSSFPPLWCYVNNSHNYDDAKGKTVKTSDYDSFYDELGYFRVAKRYGIAIKCGLARAIGYERDFTEGDYVDVYLDDGSVIQCVVFTAKKAGSVGAANGETSNCVIHNDGSIIEFVTDSKVFPKHRKNPHEVTPEFNQKIKGITLAGSWEEDKEGTGASCTKFKASDEYKTEGTVSSISSNSSGSTTSGGTASVVKADFPSNVKTMEQVIKEDGKASSSAQADRGKTKSLMGWQTQGTKYSGGLKSNQLLSQSDSYLLNRIPHDYNGGGHATDDKVGEHSSEMLPQWVFMYAAHNDNHNWDECNKAENKMRRKDINKFNSDGLAYVNGRYVVAVKPGLGELIWGEQTKVGDAIDIYLDDGTIIPAWVGEQKGAENASKVIHSDGSIVEFIVDCNKFYECCVTTHNNSGVGKVTQQVTDVYPEWKQPIKGITKVGNWFENGGKVDSPAGNAGGTQEETGGMAYLDENGQPCDPNGEVTCSGGGSWEDNFGATPGRRTFKNLVATACSAMGRTTYMWGGARPAHIGILDSQIEYYKQCHDSNKAPLTTTSKAWGGGGMDCSGFTSWVSYNTLYTSTEEAKSKYGDCTKCHGSPIYSANSGPHLAHLGVGYTFKTTSCSDGANLQTGDILGIGGEHGHVVMVIGKEDDNSVVLAQASEGGTCIRLTGTSGKAVEVAKKYNNIINKASSSVMGDEWFPEGYDKYGKFKRGGDSYGSREFNSNGRWTVGPDGLEDPDGILNMTAEQILELIIGDGMGSGGDCQNNTNSGGKTIFLDPGHGPNLDEKENTMVANGYLYNSSEANLGREPWGEWRHYGSGGTVGTNCRDCGKDGNHKCWFHYDPRGKTEPNITWGICSKLKPLLEQAGFNVVMSRTENEHPSVTKRAEDAQKSGADIQICVHCDSRRGSRGTAYCDPKGSKGSNSYKGSDWYDNSLKLNKMLNKGIASSGSGLVEHSPIPDYGYLILYEKASCPTAYLEIGDMDSKDDLSILQSSGGQQKIAEGILAGVKEYYGMK